MSSEARLAQWMFWIIVASVAVYALLVIIFVL